MVQPVIALPVVILASTTHDHAHCRSNEWCDWRVQSETVCLGVALIVLELSSKYRTEICVCIIISSPAIRGKGEHTYIASGPTTNIESRPGTCNLDPARMENGTAAEAEAQAESFDAGLDERDTPVGSKRQGASTA